MNEEVGITATAPASPRILTVEVERAQRVHADAAQQPPLVHRPPDAHTHVQLRVRVVRLRVRPERVGEGKVRYVCPTEVSWVSVYLESKVKRMGFLSQPASGGLATRP
jgi:hypothetical protein